MKFEKIYWWKEVKNFGDFASYYLVSHLAKNKIKWAFPQTCIHKDLLNILRLKFKVIPSRIKENRVSNISFCELVKKNALDKARFVADKVKSGVIIAADTIVVQDNKVFGKPLNLKDAKQIEENHIQLGLF